MEPRRSVVVTGMGVLCSLGTCAEDLWEGLAKGRSGIGAQTRFDPARFRSRLAGQIDDTQVTVPPGPLQFEVKRMSAFVRYALFAAGQAIEDSGLVVASAPSGAVAGNEPGGLVCLGVAMGGLPSIEAGVLRQEHRGVRKTSPFLIPSLVPNMAASMIALRHGIEEEQLTFAGACASGSQALGHALHAIRSGARNWAIAGGAEAVTTPITYSGFEAMNVLSRSDDPSAAPRPFDRRRDGMIVGEAAAVFMLEERSRAETRGAVIHGELSGFATNSGGVDLTGVSARHVARCMNDALADAAIESEAIDCVFAQGSGLPQGDAAELEAMRALSTRAGQRRPVVTSIKGHTGYTFAANGPMNLAAALLALRHQTAPGTLNFEESDTPFADIDVVAASHPEELCHCLINATGFGGINTSLVVSRA